MIEILAALYSDLIKRTITVMFDRVAGFAAGLVVGVLELGWSPRDPGGRGRPPSTANVSSAIRTAPAIAVDHGVLTQSSSIWSRGSTGCSARHPQQHPEPLGPVSAG